MADPLLSAPQPPDQNAAPAGGENPPGTLSATAADSVQMGAGALADRASASLACLLQLDLGNAAALAELAQRYVRRVEAWCRFLGFRGQALDEAVHDGWVHVILHLNQFDRGRGTFANWCRTAVRNMLTDLRRKQGRRAAHLDAARQDELHAAPGREADPAEEAVARELQAMIDRGLVQVALERVVAGREPRTVQAFRRRFFDDAPADVVAAELGLTVDDVHQAYSRLRKRLEIEVNRLRDLGPDRLAARAE